MDKKLLVKIKEDQQNKVIPNAPIFSNEQMRKAQTEAVRKSKIPKAPELDKEKFMKAMNKVNLKKEEQKKV